MLKYSMVIQWSEEDQLYLVFLPEFSKSPRPVTHGDSYEQAAKNGREVLESYMLVDEPQPEPYTYEDYKLIAVGKLG